MAFSFFLFPCQDFLQVLSMFAGFDFDWPPTLKAVYNAFSLAAFNLELLAPGAVWCRAVHPPL
jgi:hypothetical protein